MGEKTFQKGIYGLYIEEAKCRGIDLTFLEYRKDDKIEIEQKKKIITWGYTLASCGSLIGIVLGIYILVSKRIISGETRYRFEQTDRKKGKRIIVLSIIMPFVWVTVYAFRGLLLN